MELKEINKNILELKKLRKKKYGIPLSGGSSSPLNTLEYTQKLFKRIIESAALQGKPIYLVCEEMGVSSSQVYGMQKSRVGKRIESKILEYLDN
jgi:glutamine amidotransferase PdxT